MRVARQTGKGREGKRRKQQKISVQLRHRAHSLGLGLGLGLELGRCDMGWDGREGDEIEWDGVGVAMGRGAILLATSFFCRHCRFRYCRCRLRRVV